MMTSKTIHKTDNGDKRENEDADDNDNHKNNNHEIDSND